MLPLFVTGKETSFTMVSVAADSQLRMRAIEGCCDNPCHCHQRKQSGQETLKRVLKIVIGRLKCSSSQLIASGRVGGGRLSFL